MTNITEKWMSTNQSSFYSISTFGRVRNKHGRILKPQYRYSENGKPKCVSLPMYVGEKRKNIRIHRLMIPFMLPQPSSNHTIDHIDRNPFNNNLGNLRWANKKEQAQNRTVNRRVSVTKLTMKDLDCIYEKYKTIALSDIAREYKMPHTTLYHIMRYVHPKF